MRMRPIQCFKIDKTFLSLLSMPVPFWLILYCYQSVEISVEPLVFLTMTLLYPILEETLFRGIIQPTLARRVSGQFLNLSLANIAASSIFALTHLVNHDPLWALATFFPSLVFGFSQDRYGALLAPITLHCYYNAGYFLIAGL